MTSPTSESPVNTFIAADLGHLSVTLHFEGRSRTNPSTI